MIVFVGTSLWLRDGTGRHDAAAPPSHATARPDPGAGPAYPPAFPPHAQPQSTTGVLVELCEYGLIPVDRTPAHLEAEAESLLMRRIEALEQAQDDGSRSLGLAARAALTSSSAAQAVIRGQAECDIACYQRANRAGSAAARPAIEALAKLAVSTRDPQAYASAMQACFGSHEPPCKGLDGARWARLDPDNGHAWLQVAALADRQGDPVAAVNALERAARSGIVDARFTPMPRLLSEADAPRDAVQTLLVNRVLMMSMPAYLPDYGIAAKYCNKAALAGAERARLCSDLAGALIEKDTTLIGYALGVRLGALAGWPDERIAQLKADQKVLMEPLASSAFPANVYSCEGATYLHRHVREVLLAGEAAYGRRLLAARRAGVGK